MKRKLFAFIIGHRILVSSILAAITLFFGWFAAQVEFNNTIETYFLEDDLSSYNRFLDQFGTDEIIVIAFETGNVFTAENLRVIDRISEKLEKLPHVRRVLSLTTTKIIFGEDKIVYFDPLVDEIPAGRDELETIRRRALDDSIIPGTLVSRDARNTAIVAQIDHIVGEFDYKIGLLDEIRRIVKEEKARTGKRFSVAGTAVLDDAMFRYTEADQALLLPLMLLIIIVVMFVMFRRISMTLLPLLVVVLSVVWTYGFLVILGYEINLISVILGPLLLAVAIADSMHIVADYLQKTAADRWTKVECIELSFCDLLSPCFMTSLTTSLGMLSLLSADLAPIREFGLVAAGGVMFAFIITILLLPILFSLLPVPQGKHAERFRTGAFAKLLGWLGRWRRRKAVAILLVCASAVIPASLLLSRLTVGTNSLDYFRKDDPVRVQTEWIDSAIGGTTSLEFFIDAGREGALKEPELLRRMERFQDYLEGLDGVTGVYSAVDLVKTLNKSFHDGDERKFAIPDSALEVTQQLFIIEGSEDIEEFLSYDYSKGRISARIEINTSQEISHQMPEIEKRMGEIFGDTATATPTGLVYLMYRLEEYILSSQIKSFLLAFTVIVVTIIVMLRSLKLGLLAMIPNLLPILLTMGLMPLLDIHLDVGTVMIAGVALGLVVDDSIHFLSRLKVETSRTPDVINAIETTIIETGRPIIFTSLVLSLGFLVFLFASFNPTIHFGVLSAMVILLALVFDLVVLPAIMGFAGRASKESK